MEGIAKKEMIRELRERILVLEGFSRKGADDRECDFGFGPMDAAFPGGAFPVGAVHEFISPTAACATASNAFISGIVSTLVKKGGACMWVSTGRSLFPPALKYFGIEPHEVIFVDVKRDRDALWVMEQGLKCNAFAVVVAELGEVSFAESRRLQLSVEQSRVTGFLHRRRPRRQQTLACVSRFRVSPVASRVPDGVPGVGYPFWEVQLEKVRNGKPGQWLFEWRGGVFTCVQAQQPARANGVVRKIERYA